MHQMPSSTRNLTAPGEGLNPKLAPSFWMKAAWVGLLAAAFAAPLAFGAVQTWAWTALLVVGLLLLIAWAAGCVHQRAVRLFWSPLYVPGALFLLLGAIQLFAHLTADAFATRQSLLGFTTSLIYFFLAGQVFADRPRESLPRWGFLVAVYASLLAFFAIIQFFAGGGLIYWSIKPQWGGWIFGPYVNHNHYAGLMEMLIPTGAAYVLSRPQGHPAKLPLGIALVVPIVSLLLSGSRGGLASLLIEIQILFVIVLWVSPLSRRRSIAVMMTFGIVSVAVLFFALAPAEISKRLEGMASLSPSSEVSLGERLRVARDSLHILGDHPWLGAGLGTFDVVYPQYRSFPSDLRWDHAHNDYAEALAETGLVGGFLILSALILGFRSGFRRLRDRLSHETGWIQTGAAIGCCGLLVHALADFNFHIPANALWFAISLGIATSPGRQPRRPSVTRP
jgi:O-antigen ligase